MSTKIVIIGSGSQFTDFFLQELYKAEEFRGCTLALVDRKPRVQPRDLTTEATELLSSARPDGGRSVRVTYGVNTTLMASSS